MAAINITVKTIKLRRNTAAYWASSSIVPAAGEPIYSTDTNELRIGDGSTLVSNLTPITGSGGGGGGATTLSDLTDVGTATPTNGVVLVGNGSTFNSRALTEADISDLQTYLTSASLNTLTDVSIGAAAGSTATTLRILADTNTDGTYTVVDWTPPTGGGGEANTASNLGAGEGIFTTKSGVNLPFKSLSAGTGISLSSDANTITITSAETNDLTSSVTWANVPDINITQSSVTQHQAALSISYGQLTSTPTIPVINTVQETPNGVITAFTVTGSSYAAGTLIVIINGQALQNGSGLTENTPGSGTFTLDYAPSSGDSILCIHS